MAPWAGAVRIGRTKDVQLKRMSKHVRDKKRGTTFPTNMEELHRVREEREPCSQAIALPPHRKFSAVSLI